MIKFTEKGSFKNTERYLQRMKSSQRFGVLNKYGAVGVAALSEATPRDSGETAAAWSYTVEEKPGYYSIRWHNSHEHGGLPIAILLQYGHGTGTGGYVQGRNYIMPAIRPVFDQIATEAWKEVTKI